LKPFGWRAASGGAPGDSPNAHKGIDANTCADLDVIFKHGKVSGVSHDFDLGLTYV
jgi:hypothetical protein